MSESTASRSLVPNTLIRHATLPVAATVAVLALASCSSQAAPEQPAPATVTVTASPSESPTPTAPSAPAPTTASPKKTKSAGSKGTGSVTVPDFSSTQDYQEAQDLARGLGLSVLPAEDALGADRLPFLDSNWIVVGQKPKAGSTVAKGSSVTMTVKKFTD